MKGQTLARVEASGDRTEAKTRQAEAILLRHNIHKWNPYAAADRNAVRYSVSVDRSAR
ncbi:MAG: hypothetical protein ACAF41_05465 [Leptolyngbya sp. BL-A-14]